MLVLYTQGKEIEIEIFIDCKQTRLDFSKSIGSIIILMQATNRINNDLNLDKIWNKLDLGQGP